jgi:hypothetical protein
LAFAATLSGLSCWDRLQAGSPIDRNHRPGGRSNLSARPVLGRRSLDRPGSEDPDPKPRGATGCGAVIDSLEPNRTPPLPERTPTGADLPSVQPAFPWPHLPRGRVGVGRRHPEGRCVPSPSGAACLGPKTAATGFQPRFPGSVSRVTDRASSFGNSENVPHRIGLQVGFDWLVFAKWDYFSRPGDDNTEGAPDARNPEKDRAETFSLSGLSTSGDRTVRRTSLAGNPGGRSRFLAVSTAPGPELPPSR